jgi:hypothetical protein
MAGLWPAVVPLSEEPKLVLKAPRFVRIPVRYSAEGRGVPVQVTARLEGALDDPEDYYCLAEEWDWDDGTHSAYEPGCDAFHEEAEVKKSFSSTHTYGAGEYTITLTLRLRDEVVIQGRADIRVHR